MTLYELKMHIKRVPLVKGIYDRLTAKRQNAVLQAQRTALQTEGTSMTRAIEEALSQENVEFFIHFGSLLGLIRAGKFMDFDSDVDYGIFINDNFTWQDLERVLEERGFVKEKQFLFHGKVTEQSYKLGALSVDFFGCERDDEHTYVNVYFRKQGHIYHSSLEHHVSRLKMYPFAGVKELEVAGTTYHVPDEPEKLLASIYTENWRIPDPNWVAERGPSWNELTGEIAQIEYF